MALLAVLAFAPAFALAYFWVYYLNGPVLIVFNPPQGYRDLITWPVCAVAGVVFLIALWLHATTIIGVTAVVGGVALGWSIGGKKVTGW